MKYLGIILLFSVAFSCFSISDLSAVEIETRTNLKPLLEARNVKFEGGVFYFKFKELAVSVSEDRVRISFPVREVERFSCFGESKEVYVKCEGVEKGGKGKIEYYTMRNGSVLFNAHKINNYWRISLEYEEEFPEWIKNCVDLPNLQCTSQKIPRVSYEGDVKEAVREVLNFLKIHKVVNLSKEDIEKIANVSKLGNAGHNGRIVKEKGEWKPYYETSNPLLLKGFLKAGCGRGEIMEIPLKDISFSKSERSFVQKILNFIASIFKLFKF